MTSEEQELLDDLLKSISTDEKPTIDARPPAEPQLEEPVQKDIFKIIKEDELELQSRLLKENDQLIEQINQARGLVTQTTLDF